MPNEETWGSCGPAPALAGPTAVYATAIAVEGLALLICGASRAGKSRLALDLLATTAPGRLVELIGDDRVLVTKTGADISVSPHPRIAGLIERRGAGILAIPHRPSAPVAGLVHLSGGRATAMVFSESDVLGVNFPALRLVSEHGWETRAACVLSWFDAAVVPHRRSIVQRQPCADLKDYNW